MKNIISLALFGGHPQYGMRQYYWDCLPGFLRSYKNFFPDFDVRVYHDECIDDPLSATLRRYAEAGLVELAYAGPNLAMCRSMLWRIKPIWDESVDAALCRDLDGAACRKERRAVDVWLESGMACHTINDNPSHTEPLMGGMIGFRCPTVRKRMDVPTWEQFVAMSATLDQPTGGQDQILLRRALWPSVYGSICAHRFAGMGREDKIGACHLSVDDKWPAGVSPNLNGHTEQLVPFIGCSGVDVPKAKEIYDTLGDPVLAARIMKAENEAIQS